MAKWKLCRQNFGKEEFTLCEGESVTIGRGVQNTITLSSLVISRNHCLIKVKKNELLITDLQSSNGVFVGKNKIPPLVPHAVKDSDLIGIGWMSDVPLTTVQDNEKYIFKVTKEQAPISITSRITFQNENEFEEIEEQIAYLDNQETYRKVPSPVIDVKPALKRKIEIEKKTNFIQKHKYEHIQDNIVNIVLSDSDNDNFYPKENVIKKPKLEPIHEEYQKQINFNQHSNKNELNIKSENDLEIETFNVKQEHLGYDDELIELDSDSDSESEHWFLRLSQSSPGKPFIKIAADKKESKPEDSSYSQMDDDLIGDRFSDKEEEECLDDLITIPPQPFIEFEQPSISSSSQDKVKEVVNIERSKEHVSVQNIHSYNNELDEIDGFSSKDHSKSMQNKITVTTEESNVCNLTKKAQMIQPLAQLPRKKSNLVLQESTSRIVSNKNETRRKNLSKKHISNSQKEERKKKLKEIANKEKEDSYQKINKTAVNNTTKSIPSVKITSSNRGAFLTDSIQVVKPMTRKESPQKSKSDKEKNRITYETGPTLVETCSVENKINEAIKKEQRSSKSKHVENKKKHSEKEKKEHKSKKKHNSSKQKSKDSKSDSTPNAVAPDSRTPLKSLKPLTDGEDLFAGKPFSKVEPYKKPKKTVRFSEGAPEVHYFQIEEGNRLKQTCLVKATIRQMPIYSLEKITLMKILRWNPHWLNEQVNNPDPPPILGHNNPPMALFHSFCNHNQYVEQIGDLLLMEIWECLSIAHNKLRCQNNIGLQMRIASLPPAPAPDRNLDLFNLTVDVSVPTSEVRNLPRVGEIIIITFGPENARNQRFFFVHNVRPLPSPPSNRNSFYNISLHATFTDKMRTLKPGEVVIGVSLAYINKELSLFEAMAYMGGSPLGEVILNPEPRHFLGKDNNCVANINNPWTETLNASQRLAVNASVSAALSDQPGIQMVQGPPGTGKSGVICSIVMTYFYDALSRRQQNRGKILICATSNAAVDEIVLRLLNIRQQLPKMERFRMVRVGRAESMHPRALDISSQHLAARDAARLQHEPPAHAGLAEEISRMEAKINMWKTQAQDALGKDAMRVAYCEGRVAELSKRICLLRAGEGVKEKLRPEQLLHAERRIVEGADIVITTLASAHNHKMRGLKRRIALCIVDEAGQAIEPETLIPLTLDVTKLTLIGDPQQLPGYICSQRAKKYGLGESLFSRLMETTEQYGVILLDHQYRMQNAIADYPNRAFYGGRVKSVPPARPALRVPPYQLIGISSGDKGQNAAGGNEMEAWGVARVVAALAASVRAAGLSLAVITPYNAHKELVKRNLRALQEPSVLPFIYLPIHVQQKASPGFGSKVYPIREFIGRKSLAVACFIIISLAVITPYNAHKELVKRNLQEPSEAQIEVNTVDSFQGQERDVVVVSLARSNGVGFLIDAGRMNVILTRARHALLVCLNPHAVLKNQQWRTLLDDAEKRKLYRSLPFKMCQPTGSIPHEEVLKHIAIQ